MTYTFECPACQAHVSTDIRPTRAPICASPKHPRARQMIPTSRHTPWENGGLQTSAPAPLSRPGAGREVPRQ